MRASTPVAPLLALSVLAAPLSAQAGETADTTPAYRLEGVTVTTTRHAVDTDRIPQRIDVLDRETIVRSGAHSVSDVLRSTVPVDVIEFPGLLAGVSVRGFRPQYSASSPRTLILVDGRPAGTNNLALLEAATVERIEVLRGPASTLHGPNAMGGVVNIVSRRSTGGMSGGAMAGYGSFGSYRAHLSAGGSLTSAADFDLTLSTSGQREGYRTGSHRAFGPDSLLKRLPDGATVRLPWSSADSALDYSRFTTRSVSGRVGFRLSESWRVDIAARDHRADDVENPGDLNITDYDSRTLKDATRRSLDLTLSGQPGGHSTTVRLYRSGETIDYYSGPETPNYVNFRTPVGTYGAQLQDAFSLGPADLVLGSDLTIADARSERFGEGGGRIAPFSPDSRIRTMAFFGEARSDLLSGLATVSAGLRYDRVSFEILDTPHLDDGVPNRERNGVVTPSVGIRLRPTPSLRLYGNAGRAFVSPDPFFVAGYSEARAGEGGGVHVTRGNPRLDAERSRTWDVGASLFRSGLELDIAYFETRVRDRIASAVMPGEPGALTPGGDTILSTTSYVNVDRAWVDGLEARISYDLRDLLRQPNPVRLFLTGTRIVRAEEYLADPGLRRRIQNVAGRTWLAGVDVAGIGPVRGRISARYVADRVDSDYVAWWEPGEIEYPPYLVFDLHLASRLRDRYRVTLDVRNLSDEDYFEIRGYNRPGRSVYLGVAADF